MALKSKKAMRMNASLEPAFDVIVSSRNFPPTNARRAMAAGKTVAGAPGAVHIHSLTSQVPVISAISDGTFAAPVTSGPARM